MIGSAISTKGSASWALISCETTASVRPRANPATSPMSAPGTTATSAPAIPMMNVNCPPWSSRESKSWPSLSVPSGCSHVPPKSTGGSSVLVRSCWFGSASGNNGARKHSAAMTASGSPNQRTGREPRDTPAVSGPVRMATTGPPALSIVPAGRSGTAVSGVTVRPSESAGR
jgi:hypothetical protein